MEARFWLNNYDAYKVPKIVEFRNSIPNRRSGRFCVKPCVMRKLLEAKAKNKSKGARVINHYCGLVDNRTILLVTCCFTNSVFVSHSVGYDRMIFISSKKIKKEGIIGLQ